MKKHIAGIIPIAGLISNFNLPWHPSLMPIAPNYLAVERAVAECAYAGCNTIWIVCDDNVIPLVRYQVGEKIQDPVYNYRHFEHNKSEFKKPIRIYYVPIAIRDINKRDNLAWSAIFGAKTANNIIRKISKWLVPSKFYIAWPYAWYNPSEVRQYRREILETEFAFQFENQSVKDNLYLGFTLNMQQIDDLLSEVREKSTGIWKDPETRQERLALDERFSYRNFDLKKTFESISFEKYTFASIEEYFSISCWKEYCRYLKNKDDVLKPRFLKYSEWNEIGVDEEI